ncbi:MAG TPA: adenylate/guanylate cyclase domain-containing protein [Terriglobia bacterium]|nr:adenylate/guanylate cyclase domain-containing protein [Terriglobia bacterium]
MTEPEDLLTQNPTAPNDFNSLWWRTVRNIVLGSLISVLPAFVFYSVAFSYTRQQIYPMLSIIPFTLLTGFAVDFWLNWVYLSPFRRYRESAATPQELTRVYVRLHNLPLFSFARVFGPHALTSSCMSQLAVIYANAHWSLGIPSRDYWIYWLINLTLVPIGHAIFEYHSNGRAARQAISNLVAKLPATADLPQVWRVGLATRLAVFYTMLAISPLVLLAAAVRLRAISASSLALTDLGLVIAGVAALNLLLLLLFARDVNYQTQTLLVAFKRIQEGDLAGRVNLFSPDEFGEISDGVNKMIQRLRDRERIRSLFGIYLSTEVSRAVLDGGVELEGEGLEVSVLFCDIRDFTRFSSQRTPQQIVQRLNRFFSKMAGAISAQGGSINKFLGDGFMAVFGAPAPQSDHARRAVQAALQMEADLVEFNAQLRGNAEPELEIGIGIDSGEVIAGNVGSIDRKEYTVIGDPVNRSSRIEQLNKSQGTRILVSQRTHRSSGVGGGRALPPVTVKGIEEPLQVLEIGARVAHSRDA